MAAVEQETYGNKLAPHVVYTQLSALNLTKPTKSGSLSNFELVTFLFSFSYK